MTDGSLSATARPLGAGAGAAAGRPVRVLVVDDQPVFLRAARDLIAATPGFEEVGQATSGPQALAKAAALGPDLVLLDVRMPGMDGIETARLLADVAPDSFVVLISLEATVDAGAATTYGVDAHVRKQDLSIRTLQDLWAARSASPG
jgi:two-component system, NarL family, invasion response regulator UvrY